MSNMYIKLVAFIVAIVIVMMALNTSIFAHSSMLTVKYDPCNPRTTSNNGDYTEVINEDGEDEWWYDLTLEDHTQRHVGDEISRIVYQFADSKSGYYWTTDTSETIAEEIKLAFANSIEKWNNISFYTYTDGIWIANPIVEKNPPLYMDETLSQLDDGRAQNVLCAIAEQR